MDLYSLDELDRTLYELLRLELVSAGLLPDITVMANEAAYIAAKAAIRAANKEVVEIFGVGAAPARDEKTTSKIVIQRKGVVGGSIGANNLVHYRPYVAAGNVNKFRKIKYPSMTKSIRYEVRIIASGRDTEVILTNILYKVLGQQKCLNAFDGVSAFGSKKFVLNYDGDVDLNGGGAFMERLFSYSINDIFIDTETVISSNIVPMITVSWASKTVHHDKSFTSQNVSSSIDNVVT